MIPSDKLDVNKKSLEKMLTPAIQRLSDQNASAEVFGALIKLAETALKDTKAGSYRQLAKSVSLRDRFKTDAPKLGFLK